MMDPFDKAILGPLYLSSLNPRIAALDLLRSRLHLPQEIFNEKIQKLVGPGFVKNDKSKLTFPGRVCR